MKLKSRAIQTGSFLLKVGFPLCKMFFNLSKQLRYRLHHYIRIASLNYSCTASESSALMNTRSFYCKQKNNHYKGIVSRQNIFLRELSTGNHNWKESALSEKIKYELSVFKSVDFQQLKNAPFPALLYGFGGIIPFVFPPLYFIIGSYSPFLATSQLMYGATILAFVGGVKWGNALRNESITHDQIGISTVPSLVAWSALLVPEPVGFLIVSCGLMGALYIDLVSSRYPPWFSALRSALTGVGAVSLILTFVFNVAH